MSQEKIAHLRKLVAQAAEPQPLLEGLSEPARLQRAYDYWAYNASALGPPPRLDQSPRARAIREINRIAAWRRWGDEVARWLDRSGAESLADLELSDIEALRDHMRRLEDCGHMACDLDDEFPAR